MTESRLLIKEIWCRKTRFSLGLGVVAAGVAIIVSVQTISRAFEDAAEQAMSRLGPTTFLIPAEMLPTDYLLMDFGDSSFSQNNVDTLKRLDIPGVERLEPRLLVRWKVGQQVIVLAGVTHAHALQPSLDDRVVVGSEAARAAKLVQGASLTIDGQDFVVSQVVSQQCDATDLTVFLQLERLQRMFNMVHLINEIGVTISAAEAQVQVESAVEDTLPDLRVVTRDRLLNARLQLALGLRKQALAIAIVILALGSLSIANYMATNVRERRWEIGTLMALGASSSKVLVLFFKKAIAMGMIGGLLGFLGGSTLAYVVAPVLAGIPIKVLFGLLPASITLASGCALVGSIVPFARAASTDPATALNQAGS